MVSLRKTGLILTIGAGIGLFLYGVLKLKFIDHLSIKVFSHELSLVGYSSLGYITIANFIGGYCLVWQGIVFWKKKESYIVSSLTKFTIVFSLIYSFWLIILGFIHVSESYKTFSLLKVTFFLTGHPVWPALTIMITVYIIIGIVPLLVSSYHFRKKV